MAIDSARYFGATRGSASHDIVTTDFNPLTPKQQGEIKNRRFGAYKSGGTRWIEPMALVEALAMGTRWILAADILLRQEPQPRIIS